MQKLIAIFNGDLWFDSTYQSVDWGGYFTSFLISVTIVSIALVWSTILSVILGNRLALTPHTRRWDLGSGLLTFVSGVPFLVAGLLVWVWFSVLHKTSFLIQVPVAGILLGTCEGGLAEWPRFYCGLIEDLHKRTYFLAHKARSQSVIALTLRHIGPYFMQTLPNRISYLFSGLVVIEKTMTIKGIGWTFIEAIRNSGREYSYRDAMMSAMLIILIPVVFRSFVVSRKKPDLVD